MGDFMLDRSSLAIGSFAEEPYALKYWLGQKPETRLAGIEFLRQQFFPGEKLDSKFADFLKSPNARGVEYLVIGGFALCCFAVPVANFLA